MELESWVAPFAVLAIIISIIALVLSFVALVTVFAAHGS